MARVVKESPPVIAFDTEFVRQDTYWPILCLMQIASPQFSVAIDTLSVNVRPFIDWAIKTNPLFLVHSPRQDFEILQHDFSYLPSRIFDTQIAACFLDLGGSIGYDTLVSKILGLTVDKSSQFTDWSHRPLGKKQIDYALNDVMYLIKMHPILCDQLQKVGREDWMEGVGKSEFADPGVYDLSERDIIQKFSSSLLPNKIGSKRQLLCAHLVLWREAEAKRLNVNRGAILTDKQIAMLCLRGKVTSYAYQIRSDLVKRFPNIQSERFIDLLTHINALHPVPLTKNPNNGIAHQKLASFIDKIAKEQKIPSRYLISKKMMVELGEYIAHHSSIKDHPSLEPWRKHLLESFFNR